MRRLIERYLRFIRPAAATIRFMLTISAMVCFALSFINVRDDIEPGQLNALGLFLVCATILFIDPENPPGQHEDLQ